MTGRGPDAELAAAYRHCRAVAAEHGRTYFLATRLLSPPQRAAVHALYAFARTVDDVVDHAESTCATATSGAWGPARSAVEIARAERTSSRAASNSAAADLTAAVRLDRIDTQLRIALEDAGLPTAMPGEPLRTVGGPARARDRVTVRTVGHESNTGSNRPHSSARTGRTGAGAEGIVPVSAVFSGTPEPGSPVMRAATTTRSAASTIVGNRGRTTGATATEPLATRAAIDDRVLTALVDTIARYRIAPEHFRVFLDAMRMDVPGSPLFRNRYADMGELREYMRGSAAAIGLQLLPVLGTVVPVAEAEPAAAALGEAFQLTNFLRDVAEDLDRGRVYLPGDELAAFGVDAGLLAHCRRTGRTDPRVRRALAHLIAVNRAVYRTATPGIDLLRPRVRPAIRTAAVLYGEILDEIERHDYAVFDRRATVPTSRRLRVAITEFGSGLRRPGNPAPARHTTLPRAFRTAQPNAPHA